MAKLMTNIPDEVDERLRQFLAERGEDVDTFVTRALRSQIEFEEEDPECVARRVENIRRGLEDIAAGRSFTKEEVLEELRRDTGLNLRG